MKDFLGEITFMLLVEEFTWQEGPEMGHSREVGSVRKVGTEEESVGDKAPDGSLSLHYSKLISLFQKNEVTRSSQL